MSTTTTTTAEQHRLRLRPWLLAAASGLVLLAALPLKAQQYRSETRELDGIPQQEAASQKSLEAQLQSAQDPYTRAMIYRELAYEAANRKDYKKAQKYVEDALKAGGLSGPAADQLRKELNLLTAANKPKAPPQTVMQQLEKQIKDGTAKPEVKVAVAAEYLKKKRYAEAIPLLKDGIAKSPKPDPSWKAALLQAYLVTGREAEAIPLLQEQLKTAPHKREHWLRLAAYALKAGDKPRAAALLELAARQGHLKSVPERLQLIALVAELGAPFEAGSTLQRWMQDGAIPQNTKNWQTLAALWVRAKEAGLAITALEEAHRLSPSTKALLQMGQLQMDRGQYALAAEALAKAIAAGERSGPALMTLGLAHYQSADIEAATEAFKQAQQYAGSKAGAGKWLAYLQSSAAREQALAAAQKAAQQPREVATLSQRMGGSTLRIQGKEIKGGPLPDAFALAAAEAPAAPAASEAAAPVARLTPVGAEAAGGADGRIPAWTGGLTSAPAGYVPGQRLVDPYPADQPQFIITASNLSQHRQHLSRGHQAMFAKYPSYTMPVYLTRRSAAYPQAIYDASAANNGKAKLLGSDALGSARLGFPFIEPRNGVEVLWNHRTRYRGDTVAATYTQAVVRPKDAPQLAKQTFRLFFRYGNIKNPVDLEKENKLVYGITYIATKGAGVDFVALFHETANSIKQPRNIWVLIVKLKRMLRIPPVGYDQPFPASDAIEFIDMVDMYNGAFDRYVWKLAGKKNLYIPYNSYRLSDGSQKYAQLLKPGHIDQSQTRYEMHRVWVIEATERGGQRHSFGKRTYYVDEDSWNIVLVENEDREGKLWRFQEGHLAQQYDIKATTAVPIFTYDLKDGRYFANRLFSEDLPFDYSQPMTEAEYLPARVQSKYGR